MHPFVILCRLLPTVARASLPLTLALRALTGLCASATFPSVYHFFPAWIPVANKTWMISFCGSGIYFGEIIGFSLSGILCTNDIPINGQNVGGWSSSFYFFGLIGIAWFPFFVLNVFSKPDDHPTITQAELDLIKIGNEYYTTESSATQRKGATPSPATASTVEDNDPSSSLLEYVDEEVERDSLHVTLRSVSTSRRRSESGGGGGEHKRTSSRALSLTDQSSSVAFMSDEEMKNRIPWGAMFTEPGRKGGDI